MAAVNGAVSRYLIYLIRGYQYLLSPLIGYHCRFYPSCSRYAVIAIQTYGAWKGTYFALRRLLRCHPCHRGGVDEIS